MLLLCYQAVTSMPVRIRKIHCEQLLSVLFNTAFPLNPSHPVCISLCTTHLGQLFSVAFLHVSGLMLNPMALFGRLKILPLKIYVYIYNAQI